MLGRVPGKCQSLKQMSISNLRLPFFAYELLVMTRSFIMLCDRLPLLYAISWPARVPMPWKPLDLAAIGTLTFKAPDHAKYPCIPLAYAAGEACT